MIGHFAASRALTAASAMGVARAEEDVASPGPYFMNCQVVATSENEVPHTLLPFVGPMEEQQAHEHVKEAVTHAWPTHLPAAVAPAYSSVVGEFVAIPTGDDGQTSVRMPYQRRSTRKMSLPRPHPLLQPYNQFLVRRLEGNIQGIIYRPLRMRTTNQLSRCHVMSLPATPVSAVMMTMTTPATSRHALGPARAWPHGSGGSRSTPLVSCKRR